jgi:plasmid stabilization system protein ParE
VKPLRFTPEARDDLDRLFDFVIERELKSSTPNWDLPEQALQAIRSALQLLPANPFMGRKVGSPFERELLISFGKTGYVALYEVEEDAITIAAIRHQRESDYH